ncbi:MAG: hypothetical protein J6B04_05500 [Clostridia bacterium]|nr:hypothetical protein [Clostridia bacterium]
MAKKSTATNFFKVLGISILGTIIVAGAVGGGFAIRNAIKQNNCEHVYVDGVCEECGKEECVHNYVDGVCENCGEKEVDDGGLEVDNNTATASMMRLNVRSYKRMGSATSTGVSTVAEEGYELTATVLPEDAADKTVTYTAAWENASSTWATGKSVEDYVTLTQTEVGSLTANVTCEEAFGEPIIVTVTSNNNANAKATATLHYKQKIDNVRINEGSTTDKVLFTSSAGTNTAYDYVYGTGEDSNDITYYVNHERTDGIYAAVTMTDVYTRASSINSLYVEAVVTDEFAAVLEDLGVSFETLRAKSGVSFSSLFNKNWFTSNFTTAEDINAAYRAFMAFEGTAFKLNVYADDQYSVLSATFNASLSSSYIGVQVESVGWADGSPTEIEF